jgi:5-methylcytosine-specific restriction endonuclease McrA
MPVDTKMAQNKQFVDCSVSQVPSASWQSKVYHRGEERENLPEWKGIKKVVLARDKHSCQSCGIKIGLGVHHILPRDKGGKDYPPNLITLCNLCHNEIEGEGFTHKWQIIDYKKRRYVRKDPTVVTSNKPVRWQQWVYGGYQKS